ncbi:MAG: hypothetical protein BHV88_22820 [Clostridiales bacterium 41_12_two_minus]|nr:MAG: hypothetical protein BHV88_22820 [Clostridiales bacterium 41_12_two_minus]
MAEIKAFYDRLELNPLPSPAIALWHALMSIANKTGWQQEFTVAVSVLMLKSGLNAQAIKRARNRLEQDGYITWRSRSGNLSAIYHVNSLVVHNDMKNVPQREPQSVPQDKPQTVPQREPQSVPINKHKQNETYKEVPDGTKKKFSPPTVAEVAKYCAERKNGIDAEHFVNYYTANGWVQGRGKPIKDWKACIRTWEKQNKDVSGKTKKNSFNNFNQRQYDYTDLERKLLTAGHGGESSGVR